MSFSSIAARLTVTALLAIPLQAQVQVLIDGEVDVVRATGANVELSISGPAGTSGLLLFDVDNTPTMLLGETFPLAFTPALFGLPVGPFAGGTPITVSFDLPNPEALHGQTIFFAAVVADPGSGSGLSVSNGGSVTLASRPQLAGRSSPNYPFFEFTTAVNVGDTLEFALDRRFGLPGGSTADVFVVESRTASEWDANQALVDVRGASQTVNFPVGDTTIQGRSFTLDLGTLQGPDETPGAGDTRIGVGYDIVIDVNQNGEFDDGVDYIDGYDEAEAGFYIVRDVSVGGRPGQPNLGPYPVTEVLYTGGAFLGQNTFYPSNIAMMGQLPLVVISHGNGHDYRWYDHLGLHLASYGYVVMSHQNNTVPGSHTAADSTLANLEYLLANQGTIQGGVLDGHIDSTHIAWIGHSRGADGVARAYDQIFTGAYTPVNFSIEDIKLISSMAPVDFGGFAGLDVILGGQNNGSHPHDATFHLWVAQADDDVDGCAGSNAVAWYRLHERATQARQSISMYGVGHGDLHNGPTGSVARGPALIGRATTHQIMRGYALPLVKHYLEGDIPSRDFLWRQYESFRPIGAPIGPSVVANLMYQQAPSSEKRVLDDFQDPAAVNPGLATSGASVSFTVSDFVEGRQDDCNNNFTFDPNDPFNGFTHDDFGNPATRSDSFGSVFSYDADSQIVYDLNPIAGALDLYEYEFLSFRAAQGTRHPLTTARLEDLTFDVTLEDGAGRQSTINIGAFGGGVEEPYQRNLATFSGPCGSGLGWNSEYETIRLRLSDFRNNGTGVDLEDVRKLIFEFGSSHGSPEGRLGLDEIEFTKN
ncbi:MAG: hypothetical protein AAF196_18575 [Planctomycetota bacterium]